MTSPSVPSRLRRAINVESGLNDGLAVPVIVVHVAMVWSLRYEWQFSQATRNGYAGFLMFHAALLMIVTSLFLAERHALWLVRLAFLVVSAGALGAVFLYDVVAIYRVPVILFAAAGSVAWIRVLLRTRTFRPHVTPRAR